MSVILPPLTVTRTWAGPYCVSTALPVAVRAPLAVFAGVVVVVAVVAVAGWTAGVCGWKAITPAVPTTVAAKTIGERRIRTRTPRSGSVARPRPRAGARRRAGGRAARG